MIVISVGFIFGFFLMDVCFKEFVEYLGRVFSFLIFRNLILVFYYEKVVVIFVKYIRNGYIE